MKFAAPVFALIAALAVSPGCLAADGDVATPPAASGNGGHGAGAAPGAAPAPSSAMAPSQDPAIQAMQKELQKMQLAAQLRQAKAQAALAEITEENARLQAMLQAKETRDRLSKVVLSEMEYADEPLQDGVLTLTDRRVELNGEITEDSVKPVIERIQFFSNQSTKPIFLVIDSSGGGSVMAGLQVIKAMDSSRAPVHVVVKTFAASMAATICTAAKHSYVYPNTVMLHHQLSSGNKEKRNLLQQREDTGYASQLYVFIAQPVAAKMGLSIDEYVKEMYRHNSDGNWRVFGEEAVKMHWAEHVVAQMRELGVREIDKTAGGREKSPAPRASAGHDRPNACDCWYGCDQAGE